VQGILAGGAMSQAPYWVSSFQADGAYSSAFAGFLTFWYGAHACMAGRTNPCPPHRSSVILFQTLVPISLYLTVELVKTCQAYLIHSDGEMYHRASDTVCVPRAWNLSDDLGQIEYLFSDKTGTLTRNVMEFRRISVGGRAYGHLGSPQADPVHGRVTSERLQELEAQMVQRLGRLLPYAHVPPSRCAFVDPQLIEDVAQAGHASGRLREFFTLLAVCHTVLIEKDDAHTSLDVEEQPHLLQYKAQSPDEAALLATSRDLGFAFLGREQERVRISLLGHPEDIAILHVIEFNSTRKRMSVIVRRADGRLVLYCKGADSTVYERLAAGEAASPLGQATLEHLEVFAEDGLRTLCLASRQLDEDEYRAWSRKHSEASKAVHGREVLLDALADELERGLRLLGATAIEDRLQEGVPECIERLQRAGLRIWVLTGDKLETAINIGFSCRLLTKAMTLLIVKSTDVESTREQLRSAYEKIWSRYFAFGELVDGESAGYALIIEGTSLKHAFDQRCRKLFLDLSSRCTAVICCRVSPLQKAKVVELLKRGRNAMTLAIGDGANDVSMIQAADIGVGISGQEGMQAVMASDYAISQFRFLSRLLLVHGRWSYLRTAEVTLLSFYKNIVFVVLLYWYQFFCGFTAQYVYDYMFLLYFNLLFTVAPIFALGILDRDLDAGLLTRLPPIYSLGIRQSSYSMRLFALYVLDAIYQSLVCFFVPYGAYADIGLVSDGYTENKALLGNVMALAVIVSCNLYSVVNTFSWTLYTWLAIPLALLIPVGCLLLYSLAPSLELYSTARVLLEPLFWATFLLACVIALAPRVLLKYVQTQWRPTDLDVAREIAKYGGPLGEDQLAATVGQEHEPGREEGFTAVPADLLVPPPKAMLHREDGYPMDAVVPTAAEEERRPLRHSPSSFFTDSVLRRRILPLGSRRSPTLRIFNLRTGRFERINGFAFSQEEGMRGLIEGRAVPAFGTSIGQPEVEQAVPRPAMAATASSSSFMHSGSNDIKF
jgi:phospholipid-translocating ATPase